MISAILPIKIQRNPFWSSSQGLKCIDAFLSICRQVSEIDSFIVITHNDDVRHLAEKHNIKTDKYTIPGNIDRPYTYEQIQKFAENFKKKCTTKTDALIILDHRNLFLTEDDIIKAISLYKQNPESGVINLAFCWDYPCQYKSYYNYLGFVVFNFDSDNKTDTDFNTSSLNISKVIYCNDINDDINICISGYLPDCTISFRGKNQDCKDYLTQIIPIDSTGPQYDQSKAFYIETCQCKKLLKFNNTTVTGVIVILIQPSKTGEYDTVELFTPGNAPWELSGIGGRIIDTKKSESMNGRQKFPSAYTYDGSICVLGINQLEESLDVKPIPLVLNESKVVLDWVDYLHVQSYEKIIK